MLTDMIIVLGGRDSAFAHAVVGVIMLTFETPVVSTQDMLAVTK